MRNLFRLILRFNHEIIFIILEIIALTLVFEKNPLPHARLLQLTQDINGFLYTQANHITRFMHLSDENTVLVTENARLKNELANRPFRVFGRDSFPIEAPTGYHCDYLTAMVINNSVNKPGNYMTLNVGSRQGIQADMGVVGSHGIVGVIRNVSPNFSTVLSVLNPNFKGSVKLAGSGYFGTLSWPGRSYREAVVTEIPGHINVAVGDTIVTTGFSSLFPEGEMVGFVSEINRTPAGTFYELTVRLSEDFKKLSRVYVIRNFNKEEQKNLERQNND